MADNEQLEDVDPEEGDFIPDVYFCVQCNRPFNKLGDKFRHIQAEHPPLPVETLNDPPDATYVNLGI